MLDPVPDVIGLRAAYGCFPSGVTALCAQVAGTPCGMAASSFTSVSINPPLVSVCVAHESRTWPTLATAPRLGVSVLSSGHAEAARLLAAKEGDRFAGLQCEVSDDGALFVHGSSLWLDCSVHDQVVAGDHDIVILRVEALRVHPDVTPIVFHGSRFRRLEA